jgi:hypothetical protein
LVPCPVRLERLTGISSVFLGGTLLVWRFSSARHSALFEMA